MSTDHERWQRWLEGRRERGLPLDAPFQGDPVQEAREEALDLLNYLDECARQRLRTPEALEEMDVAVRRVLALLG